MIPTYTLLAQTTSSVVWKCNTNQWLLYSEIKQDSSVLIFIGTCCRVASNRLDRFEKTNEMLINFNGLSNVRLQQMNERFLQHTRTLVEMKKDLDSVFRRIRWVTAPCVKCTQTHTRAQSLIIALICLNRTLKGKIAKQYPEAFSSQLQTLPTVTSSC